MTFLGIFVRIIHCRLRYNYEKEFDLFFWGGKKLPKIFFFLHISSSYAKILGETNFHAREIPRSGWKVEGGEKEERKRRKKKKVGENNGQLRFVRHHEWHTQACLEQNLFTLWLLWFNIQIYLNSLCLNLDAQRFHLTHYSKKPFTARFKEIMKLPWGGF